MPEDYYDNTKEESMDEGGDKEMPHTPGKTYLVNKSICEGMKPGDDMVVHIERVLDNEYEISYSEEPHDEKKEGMDHEEGDMDMDMKDDNPGSKDLQGMMY